MCEYREELDKDGLPLEYEDNFSESPLDFEEMTEALWADTKAMCQQANLCHRESKDYPVLSDALDKLIRKMGSCCVTKAVLEQKGMTFSHLDDLSVEKLYSMVSYHFRKTHAAFTEKVEKENQYSMNLLNLEYRWYDLAQRLKATGDKVRQIRDGKINVDRMLNREQVFRDYKPEPRKPRHSADQPSALPVLGTFARSAIRKMEAKKGSSNAVKIPHGYEPTKPYQPMPFPEEVQDAYYDPFQPEPYEKIEEGSKIYDEIQSSEFQESLKKTYEKYFGPLDPEPDALSESIPKKAREKPRVKKKKKRK